MKVFWQEDILAGILTPPTRFAQHRAHLPVQQEHSPLFKSIIVQRRGPFRRKYSCQQIFLPTLLLCALAPLRADPSSRVAFGAGLLSAWICVGLRLKKKQTADERR